MFSNANNPVSKAFDLCIIALNRLHPMSIRSGFFRTVQHQVRRYCEGLCIILEDTVHVVVEDVIYETTV